jgi:hypothetical protein
MKKRKSPKQEIADLRVGINEDLLRLNHELNSAVNRFFNNAIKHISSYNKTDLTFNKLVIGITDFNELVDIVEDLFPVDAPFSKNIRYRGERAVAIRQVTYTIGIELGLSYSHMVRVLNNRHGAKVSHHSNMIHAGSVVTNAIEMGDRVILSVWNKIMETLNSRKETFVNLKLQELQDERAI